jgi:hypothetical protein
MRPLLPIATTLAFAFKIQLPFTEIGEAPDPFRVNTEEAFAPTRENAGELCPAVLRSRVSLRRAQKASL